MKGSALHNPVIRLDRRSDRRYLVSHVGVAISAPAEILRVLDITMLHVPTHQDACRLTLIVSRTTEKWQISDEFGVVMTLCADTAAPEVAGALTTAIVERVAHLTNAALVSGVIIAKGDFALAMVGDDWGSCIAVALHLSLRGWSIVTPRYAFVDHDTRTVEPFSKLLYIPSRIIPLIPLEYRRALEASPWYSTGNELGFYGVDPQRSNKFSAWDKNAILRAGLIVDSSRRELLGSVREPAHTYVGTLLPFSDVGIASASLVVGSIVPTTDAVERWANSLLAVV
jgi:hypothetical protein